MKFETLLHSGHGILWVQSYEEKRAIRRLKEESGGGYLFWSWDMVTGLTDMTNDESKPMPNAIEALNSIKGMDEFSILFFMDAHKWIKEIPFFRTLKSLIPVLEANQKHIVFISPVIEIPPELLKDITIVDMNLPTIDELMELAKWAIKQAKKEKPNLQIELNEKDIESALGLTENEAKNAFLAALVEKNKFDRSIIESEKFQSVKKSGIAEIYNPVPEERLGGLGRLKKYLHQRLEGFLNPKIPKAAKPKGILLVGLPGGGKSLAAKVVASIFGLKMLRLDAASLKGGIVGQTEANTKKFWALAKAVAPCVIFMDEIEKAFGGVQSSNRTDGGTGAASFGIFLTEMQEAAEQGLGIYIVATCNDISELLAISQGAFLRRFDDIFFVDLPNDEERRHILHIMNDRFGTHHSDNLVQKMENWTGAEIEKFVSASLYEPADEAFQNVKPIYLQNKVKIESARDWAKTNARLANNESKPKTGNVERRVKV